MKITKLCDDPNVSYTPNEVDSNSWVRHSRAYSPPGHTAFSNIIHHTTTKSYTANAGSTAIVNTNTNIYIWTTATTNTISTTDNNDNKNKNENKNKKTETKNEQKQEQEQVQKQEQEQEQKSSLCWQSVAALPSLLLQYGIISCQGYADMPAESPT